MQNSAWLGDMVDEVFKIELHDGNTMIIPTGWIHAVVSQAAGYRISRSGLFTCSTHRPTP